MYVTSLTIRKQESYEKDAGQLKGTIVLESHLGKQEVQLSAAGISRVFGVIAQEVIDRAHANAQMVRSGMDDAVHGPLLAAASEVPELS